MAKSKITTCPSCGQPLTLTVLGNPPNNGKLKTLESTTAGVFDAPGHGSQAHGEYYYAPDEIAHRPWYEIDAAAFVTAGVFVGGMVWFLFWWLGFGREVAGGFAAGVTIALTIALHILRLKWRAPSPPSPAETKIKIEMRGHDADNSKSMLIDYIDDSSIKVSELRRVAHAVEAGCNFSRYALVPRARISNPKYGKILSEFKRLGFCYVDSANQTHLTRGGRAFLRQLAKEK